LVSPSEGNNPALSVLFPLHPAELERQFLSMMRGGPAIGRQAAHASHLDMDEAFCAHMRAAIEAGLENAPIGVVTTPGTKNPKYVPAEPLPLPSSQRAMEHA
jgi:hypothetical protein